MPVQKKSGNLLKAPRTMCRFLVAVISPLIGQTLFNVKNSVLFVETMRDVPIHSQKKMSLGVRNLSTEVFKDKAPTMVRYNLKSGPFFSKYSDKQIKVDIDILYTNIYIYIPRRRLESSTTGTFDYNN